MPIYEFHCKTCRSEFKTLRPAHQLDSVACPSCESPKVARLLSVTARTASDTPAPAACNASAMPMGGGCCGGGCGRVQ